MGCLGRMKSQSLSITRVLAKYIGESHAIRLLGIHHQERFETLNVYTRPKYLCRDDGTKWMRGSNICILANGDIVNSDKPQPQITTTIQQQQPAINSNEFMYENEDYQEEESSTSTDIRNIHGIGPKSEKLLRSKGIDTVEQLFDCIQAENELFDELNKEIRGFHKIIDRVQEINSQSVKCDN